MVREDLRHVASGACGVDIGKLGIAEASARRQIEAEGRVSRNFRCDVRNDERNVVEALGTAGKKVAIDGRLLVMLLDELDLHRAGLRNGNGEVDLRWAPPVSIVVERDVTADEKRPNPH